MLRLIFNEWVVRAFSFEAFSWGFGGMYKFIFPPVVTYAKTSKSLTIDIKYIIGKYIGLE